MNVIPNLKYFLQNNARQFHLSIIHKNTAKTMKKVMGGTVKKKFKFHDTPTFIYPSAITKGAFEGRKSVNSKRANVLNKLFMRYITDLMATGNYASAFVGHGIEINRVQITPDYSCVRIYWIAKGTERDDVVEQLLNNNTGNLRHELAQLKIVGVIPLLKFIKDKQYAQIAEVNRLLEKADYGDDYIPVDLSTKFKTDLQLVTNLDPHIRKQIKVLDEKIPDDDFIDIPPMPNNVFGLNHTLIMHNVEKAKKKSQALHRLEPTIEMESSTAVNKNPVIFGSIKEEKEAFNQFLQKQQILKSQAQKEDKNYKPELDYLEEEWKERQQNADNYLNTLGDTDFIEDNYESTNK